MKFITAILITFIGTSALAAESYYTSVEEKDCITLDSETFDAHPEIDHYHGLCSGQGPYTVKIQGGDVRYGVEILYRGEEINNKLTKLTSFHSPAADLVEWRYSKSSPSTLKPDAFIFRISAHDHLGEKTSLLHVVRLQEKDTCTVSILKDEENDNIKAQKIADNIQSYPCL